jgi:hypothetical protein
MEVIDIGLNNLEQINLNLDGDSGYGSSNINVSDDKSINFGPGIELLMNENRKRSSSNGGVNIDLGELDNLEQELNDLSSSSNSKTLSGFASNLFNMSGMGGMSGGNTSKNDNNNTSNTNQDYKDVNLGQATKETFGNTKTWDGFSKMNDIPDRKSHTPLFSNMNEREKRRKKRMMIKKLEEWNDKGSIKGYSNFNIDSPYEEIEDEYETALEDKRKKDSIKLQGWWFMTFVNSIEYANAAFNPFDLNLDGWGEQVNEDIESYEEIFVELHDKYKGGKLSPELSLLLRLGFSAAVVNFTNKALSTATPGFNDVIRQSPELMRMFTNATVDSMKQASPGFSLASNLMNNPEQINNTFGPPPPPIETKNQQPQQRPNMQFTQAPNNRQDINAARGAMLREPGLELNNQYSEINSSSKSMRPNNIQQSNQPQSQFNPPSYQQQPQQQQQQQQQQHSFRMEMKGPQNIDLDNILSGLKTKNTNDNEINTINLNTDEDSMISITSLKDLQNNNPPKRSRGRRKSDKSIILDI